MKIQFNTPILNRIKLSPLQQKQRNSNLSQDKFIKNSNISFGIHIVDDYSDEFDFDDWPEGPGIRNEDFSVFPYEIPIETLLSINDTVHYSNPKNVAETFKKHSKRLSSLEIGMEKLRDESRKMLEAINENRTDINTLKRLAREHQKTIDAHALNIADLSYFLALNDLRLTNLENAVFPKSKKVKEPEKITLSKKATEVLKSYYPKLTDDDSVITPEKLTEILNDYVQEAGKPTRYDSSNQLIIRLALEHPELYPEITKGLPKETRIKFLKENKLYCEGGFESYWDTKFASTTCVAAILIKNKKTPKYLLEAMEGFSPEQIENILYRNYDFYLKDRHCYPTKTESYRGTIAGELARWPKAFEGLMEIYPPSERKNFLKLEALIYNRNKNLSDLTIDSVTKTTVEGVLAEVKKED